jgi:aerobic carbon-monoxide dehydrogenase medium subunit
LALFRPNNFVLTSDKNEALTRLKTEGKHAHVIAGGTGFYELARRGYIPEVKTIVSIMGLGLNYVNLEAPGLVQIGATTTLQQLLESKIGDSRGIEAIGDALREIRPLQVRNVATVGGEVCISVPIVDLPPALLACNASLTLMRILGEKTNTEEIETNLEDFYIDAFLTKLKYGEIVKQVVIPLEQPRNGASVASAFVKFGRTAYDFNLINVAIQLSVDRSPQAKITSIRIFLGGIKRTPIRASEIEQKILGRVPDERTITEAAKAVFSKKVNLLPSVHGSSDYKREVLPVTIRDCLNKAYARATENESKSAG